jgi:hypothetical protein
MNKMKVIVLSLMIPISCHLNAQMFKNIELSGGWAHVTGNNGLDGYNLGAAAWFSKRVSIAFDFDKIADTTSLSAFALQSTTGLITIRSSMQDYLIGPRVFFSKKDVKVLRSLLPFAEFQVGGSHLNTKVSQVGALSQSASDNAGTWLLGGGGDFLLGEHWSGRINLGLMRTHLSNAGQSRLRTQLGVAYTFGSRKVK